MQERNPEIKKEQSLFDCEKAKVLMLSAVQQYLQTDDKNDQKTTYGIFHGRSGVNRANRAFECLNYISDSNKPAILALLLAIFDKPLVSIFAAIGRSSALASMIADVLIDGEYRYGGRRPLISNLSSTVFAESALAIVKRLPHAMRHVSSERVSFAYFDKTRGVRFLLQDVLNSREFIHDKAGIELLAAKLKATFTKSSTQINMTIFNDLNDQFRDYKKSVAAASFETATIRLPSQLGKHIGSFFSLTDSGKMARLNVTTRDAATRHDPTKRR